MKPRPLVRGFLVGVTRAAGLQRALRLPGREGLLTLA